MERHRHAEVAHRQPVDPFAEPELRHRPDRGAGHHHERPAVAHGKGQHPGAHEHEEDVHRQDVQQRRLVDQQQPEQEAVARLGQVVRHEVLDRRLVDVHAERGDHGEQKQQDRRLAQVDLERAPPEGLAHRVDAAHVADAAVDQPRHEGRQQHEALGGRHEAERLAQRIGQPRGQVGDGHQHEHQPAQGVYFPVAFHSVGGEVLVAVCAAHARRQRL
ncbi:hypothetical protein D3C72_1143900 [compost metagenome]